MSCLCKEAEGFGFVGQRLAELEQDHESFVAAWALSDMARFDAGALVFGFSVRSELGPAASAPRQLELRRARVGRR